MAGNKKETDENVPCFCSQRWLLSYTSFLGFCCVYAVRVNFSVAIVCMVKPSGALYNGSSQSNLSDIGTCVAEAENTRSYDHAEFEWDKNTRSTMLASFFYGYICTQIIGGWLSDRFGGRRVLGYTTLLASICTLVTPVCARASIVMVYVLRVILGLSTGVSFPAMQSIWGRWAPPLERTKLVSVSYLGTMFGNVATFATSGLLCDYGFDNGWGSIFYITGGLTFLWVLMWFYVASDSPEDHKRITDVEREYITSNIEYNTTSRTARVPWKELVKSRALWAVLTAHVCNNWTNYTLLTSLPAFMKAVLHFDIKQNGVLSAVPYLCQALSGFLAGQSADFLRSRKILSTTATRRVYQVLAFVGAGVFSVITGFSTCEKRDLAVVYLSLAVMFTGISRAAYVVNHVDFAPKYAGVLYGITNTAATVPGMVAPIVAGALTPNDTPEEWRNVFYVCAAFDLFGALVFGMFGSGELEPWARDEDYDKQVDVVVNLNIEVGKTDDMTNKVEDGNIKVGKTDGLVNKMQNDNIEVENSDGLANKDAAGHSEEDLGRRGEVLDDKHIYSVVDRRGEEVSTSVMTYGPGVHQDVGTEVDPKHGDTSLSDVLQTETITTGNQTLPDIILCGVKVSLDILITEHKRTV
ncbi:sialin-like isoform X2 [Argopecten irradians]|uniref:sialin-like isoform X2 n=1 Tax=Argopecten irradians TaxID=31199 RepID=UPI003718AABA